MSVKVLTEHHLEFLSLKGDCTGSSDSSNIKLLPGRKFFTTLPSTQVCTLVALEVTQSKSHFELPLITMSEWCQLVMFGLSD